MKQASKPPVTEYFNSAAITYYDSEALKNKFDRCDIDLNEVIQTVFKKFEDDHHNNSLIKRLDQLPVVEGSEQQLVHVFYELVAMIVAHPPLGSKPYLYVKCQSGITDLLKTPLKDGYTCYALYFHTNITADAGWQQLYAQKLQDINAIINLHNGCFTYNNISKAGCLFSLNLPGKLN